MISLLFLLSVSSAEDVQVQKRNALIEIALGGAGSLCDANPCGGCGTCLSSETDYFCVCNGADGVCPTEPATPPEPEECEPGFKMSQSELGVDGTFEELASIATQSTNSGTYNSNVKAGGWTNGFGSCDSWMAPVPVRASTTGWKGLSSGTPASPQGGVFAACRGGESMVGTFQNMVVGQQYILKFYQSNSGQTPHSKVGLTLRWEIKMNSGADGQIFKSTPMPYDGAGSQRWMQDSIEFTARSTTVVIQFQPIDFAAGQNTGYEVMAADGLVMYAVSEEEVPCTGCELGYSGDSCEVGPTCSDDVCYNGGTCVATGAGIECNCAPGYSGIDCLTTSCDPNPCTAASGGTCFTNDVNVVCNYPGEWTGKDCSDLTDPCAASDPCLNGGTCSADDSFNAVCECPSGWAGDICDVSTCTETEPDYCSPEACDVYCHPNLVCPCSCPGAPTGAPTWDPNPSPSASPTVCTQDDFCTDTPCDEICDDTVCSCKCSSDDTCTITKALRNRDIEGICSPEECAEDPLPDCTGEVSKIDEVNAHGIGCCPKNCKFVCSTDLTEAKVGMVLSAIEEESASLLFNGLALVGTITVLFGVYRTLCKGNKHGEFQPIIDKA